MEKSGTQTLYLCRQGDITAHVERKVGHCENKISQNPLLPWLNAAQLGHGCIFQRIHKVFCVEWDMCQFSFGTWATRSGSLTSRVAHGKTQKFHALIIKLCGPF